MELCHDQICRNRSNRGRDIAFFEFLHIKCRNFPDFFFVHVCMCVLLLLLNQDNRVKNVVSQPDCTVTFHAFYAYTSHAGLFAFHSVCLVLTLVVYLRSSCILQCLDVVIAFIFITRLLYKNLY